MGRTYDGISESLAGFLTSQPVFFVATAPLEADGLINCSPKGNRDEFVVAGEREVLYLDQTGSGIETVAHLRQNGRIVVMFTAFSGPPRIVRLHGRGEAVPVGHPDFAGLAARFPGGAGPGVRAVIRIAVERISDSCGYGVPLMEFTGHRPTMDQWAERKGADGIRTYQQSANVASLDGLPGLETTAP